MVVGGEYSNWRAGSNVRESLMSTPRTSVVFPAAAAGPGAATGRTRAPIVAKTTSAGTSRRGRRKREEGSGGIGDLRVSASLGAGCVVSSVVPGERPGNCRGLRLARFRHDRKARIMARSRMLRRQPRMAGRTELVADYAAYFCGEWMPFSQVRIDPM